MATGQAYCYYPNGDLVDGDIPCFREAEVSSCCGQDWTCLANGLCYSPPDGILSRGSCTDPKWDSPDCPRYCTENEYTGAGALDFRSHGPSAWSCSNKWIGEGGLMCCDITGSKNSKYNGTCCSGVNAINLFSIGSKPGNATSISLQRSSSSTNIPLSTASTSSAIPSSATDSLLESPSQKSAITFSPISSSTPTSSSAAIPKQSTVNGRTIAIAVSASIGSVALMIVIFLVYQHRRSRGEHRLNQNLNKVDKPKETYEISGQQEHEVPENLRAITQELPE